jgi:hypothetical protein
MTEHIGTYEPPQGPPASVLERAIRKRMNRATARLCENLEAADAADDFEIENVKIIVKSELNWIGDDLCEIARAVDDGRGNR